MRPPVKVWAVFSATRVASISPKAKTSYCQVSS
jgi:hypothetical protein